ncbi:MAG: putative ABC transporter permease [Ruminococcus sp.]|nr:putative ABC transporter permease [Ruminococcus sp.]
MNTAVSEVRSLLRAKHYEPRKPTYQRLFWLFMIASIAGVIIEGVWYYFQHDHWETHVVSVWGPFCIIYGLGASGCYAANYYLRGKNIIIKFLVYAFVGDAVELLCGLVLRYTLNMRAWTYEGYPLNFMGLICIKMTIIWGFAGLGFGLLVPIVDSGLDWLSGKFWDTACLALTAFMIVNFTLTGICLARWAARHEGHKAGNSFTEWIDEKYDDDYMEKRFCEWHFRS